MDNSKRGVYLKLLRMALGINQVELAKKIGASRQTIVNFETGKTLSKNSMFAIALYTLSEVEKSKESDLEKYTMISEIAKLVFETQDLSVSGIYDKIIEQFSDDKIEEGSD